MSKNKKKRAKWLVFCCYASLRDSNVLKLFCKISYSRFFRFEEKY